MTVDTATYPNARHHPMAAPPFSQSNDAKSMTSDHLTLIVSDRSVRDNDGIAPP
ncbi:MAG: hypothetical protein ACR2QH_06730 [Geminicoccaceae bacterium]